MEKIKKNRIITCVLSLMMIFVLSVCAFCAEQSGTITMNLQFNSKTITDGEFQLYKIGEYVETVDNINKFTKTTDFVPLVANLDDRFSTDSVKKIVSSFDKFVEKNDISPLQTIQNTTGQIDFTNLDKGLYAIKQTRACSGFEIVNSFLVELPGDNNTMAVIANEKFELNGLDKPTQPVTPTKPVRPSENGHLPQTGLNNLPVPIFMACGLVFIIIGALTRDGYRKKEKTIN